LSLTPLSRLPTVYPVAGTLQHHCLLQTVYVQRQHRSVQDQDWPKLAEVTIANERDIAGNRERAKRDHARRAECCENEAGSKRSNNRSERCHKHVPSV